MDDSLKKSILVVDDEPELVEIITFFLQSMGHNVFNAFSGRTALKELMRNSQTIDLILSDVRMADGSGTELIDSCKKQGIDVPILLMSGFANLSEAEAKNMGAIGIVSKPVDFKFLEEIIKKS